MKWNDKTVSHIRAKLATGRCPLCGGKIRDQRRRVMVQGHNGRHVDYVETVCDACGMVVDDGRGEGGFDGDF